ncbi:DUF896 domain-containing protein [Hutsoniella sourekii]|uniref:DUF896 domain-containing protein n=1 Tax=Hutsoniella sourekii TaxID=87650 RepID=UPI000486B833|nr:DUF896 domain-containing protein [Hutsoniella sourekii]
MLSKEKMARLNELAAKKKSGTLTDQEQAERKALHQEYLKSFRQSFANNVEGIKIVDPKGNDLTPEKVKDIQKEKGLHGRDQEL